MLILLEPHCIGVPVLYNVDETAYICPVYIICSCKNFKNLSGIYGYHGNRKIPFIKITVAIPRLIAPAKRLLEQGFNCPGYGQYGFQSYESNIDFEIR